MATQPILDSFVSVQEYLATAYEPDCEFVNGSLEARSVGEKDHSILQRFLVVLFAIHRSDWAVEVFPELRLQITHTHFRVPDVTVVRSAQHVGQILTTPPLVAVEIMSPEDTLPKIAAKSAQCVAFGVENVWVLDPLRRVAYRATRNGLELVGSGECAVPDSPIRVSLADLFAELDRG